ncbi:hypothetical protein VFPPC_17963 [Pochonia chlamydosporia 170]|uniref:BZIP domain-containing protein n=1 Tax=Pochonia chlamydosporia 170 TaxID=1380566 RepID=A0A219ARA4_METCM|nr:hypothetical protein VFPPC_17963 [Pochonia chlamydosporia 170]OWT42844.1 hypothetical protein VFPPC_17963 [Pochonia chlamydosporia 170]
MATKSFSVSASFSKGSSEWTEVSNRGERRRLQNRIAQRRFRQKAKENREKENRELENKHHAGNIYRTPSASYLKANYDVSGLPWGSLNLDVVSHSGHVHDAQQGIGLDTSISEPHQTLCPDVPSLAPFSAPNILIGASCETGCRTSHNDYSLAPPTLVEAVEEPALGFAWPHENSTDSAFLPADGRKTGPFLALIR